MASTSRATIISCPRFLTNLSPKRFGPGSTFTAVIRYDRVNTNLDNSNGTGGWGNLEQVSFGLNYRPIEDTVFKMSYQYQPMAFNPSTNQRIHDNAFGDLSRDVFLNRWSANPLARGFAESLKEHDITCEQELLHS